MHFHVSLDSSWWSMFQNISIRHQKPLNWKIFPLICSRASTWVDRPYWDVPVTSFILNLPHWITWRPWDIFIFYYVSHVFILPIAEPSAEASFVSFNFDWQEWRSNPARKKKNNSPCQMYYEKRSCQLTARLNVKGSLLKELIPPSDTTCTHSKRHSGNYLSQYCLQSARVCLCSQDMVYVHLCVCRVVLETCSASTHNKCHIMQMLQWV